MAVVISKMSGVLSLNSKGFTKGLARAGKRARGFGKSIVGIAGKVGGMGAALAGVAGIAGIGALTASSLKGMDSTSKLADAIGTTTEKLGGLHHAASIGGADAKSMDKSLKFLAKTIGETSTGISTEGIQAFEMLGLEMSDLEGRDTSDVFVDIADKIGKMESATERAAIAQRLFGRGGMQMMSVMQAGGDGIRSLMSEADALGMTFDRSMGAKTEAANDAIARMQGVFKGLGNQIAVHVAPFIVDITNRIVEFIKKSGGMGKLVTGAFEKVAKGIAFVGDIITGLKGAFNIIRAAGLNAIGLILEGLNKLGEGAVFVWNLLPGVEDRELPTFLGDLGAELKAEAAKIGLEALDQFDAAFSGKSSKSVEKYFKDVNESAAKAAADVAATSAERLAASAAAATATTAVSDKAATKAAAAAEKTSQFLSGKAERVAFGGPGGVEKKVAIKGDQQQTALLEKIANSIAGQRTVGAM